MASLESLLEDPDKVVLASAKTSAKQEHDHTHLSPDSTVPKINTAASPKTDKTVIQMPKALQHNRAPSAQSRTSHLSQLTIEEVEDQIWENLPDEEKVARRRRRLSMFILKWLAFTINGCFLTLVPAVVGIVIRTGEDPPIFSKENDQNSPFSTSTDLVRWSAFFTFEWLVSVLIVFIVSGFRIFSRSQSVVNKLLEIRRIEIYSLIVVVTALAVGAFAVLFPVSATGSGIYDYIFKAWITIFVVALVVFAQKLAVYIISENFYREAFKDREENRNFALKAIDKLIDATSERDHPKMSPGTADKKSTKSINLPPLEPIVEAPSVNVSPTPSDKHASTNAESTHSPGNDSMKEKINKDEERDEFESPKSEDDGIFDIFEPTDPYSDTNAALIARRIFYGLAKNKRFLTYNDIESFFSTTEQAKRAFLLFDRDGNGDVTKREMNDAILSIFKECRDLKLSKKDITKVASKLDYLFWVPGVIIIVISALLIFGASLSALVSLGGVVTGLGFAISSSAQRFLESLNFIFSTHPYDVGDRVFIDGQNLIVKEFGLTTTTFIRADGQEIYAPNYILQTKFIHNLRRSGPQSETIEFQIDFYTPTEKIQALKDKIAVFLQSENREFNTNVNLHVQEVENTNRFKLMLFLDHKSNWQDMLKRWNRRTKFYLALKDALTELQIRYTLPLGRTQMFAGDTYIPEKDALSLKAPHDRKAEQIFFPVGVWNKS